MTMQGMIQEQMAPQGEPIDTSAESVEQAPAESTGSETSGAALRKKMEVPGPLGEQLDKVVLAGMKIMFDQKTHHLMAQELDRDGDTAEKLGMGVAGLMGLLMEQSQRSIPPQLLIPAGVVLMGHAADFVRKSGDDVTDEEFGEAVEVFLDTIMGQAGIDSNKVAEFKPREGMVEGSMARASPELPDTDDEMEGTDG